MRMVSRVAAAIMSSNGVLRVGELKPSVAVRVIQLIAVQ